MKKRKAEVDGRSLLSYFALLPRPKAEEQPDDSARLTHQEPIRASLQPLVTVAAATADNRQRREAPASCPPPPLSSFACGAASAAAVPVDTAVTTTTAAGAAAAIPPGQQGAAGSALPTVPQPERGARVAQACVQQQAQQQDGGMQQQRPAGIGSRPALPLPQQQQQPEPGGPQADDTQLPASAGTSRSSSSSDDGAMPGVPGSSSQGGDAVHAAAAAASHAAFESGPAATGAAAGGSGAAGGGGRLTDYELQRLERIRRNQEMMVSMGLGAPGIEPRKQPPQRRKQPARRRAAAGDVAPAAAPVRRSGRTRGAAAGSEAGAAGLAAAAPQLDAASDPEPELEYDDSSVRRYVCEVLAAPAEPAGGDSGSDDAPGGRVTGFRQLPGCLHDPALARAYSVDWRPGLLVAGGKDGVVSIYGSRQLESGRLAADEAVAPLLSHKLHKGWVSDVQFASAPAASTHGGGSGGSSGGGGGDVPLLLTAGNDGTVCLWDLGRSAGSGGGKGGLVPQCLARACHLHDGGIFSLHERGGRLVTASKDGTVDHQVSSLGGTASLAAVQRYDELHEGVVKCARWREGGGTFASCGNDRSVCVVDTRQPPAAGASVAVEGAHASAVNVLRWHPADTNLLLTASHDPAILLHDLRRPGQPLHRLLGHAAGARITAIYQPCFVAGGAAVATGCERSQLVSLYCTATGATISRGAAGFTPGATTCGARRGDPLICSAGRAVYLLQPTWGATGAELTML